MPHLQQHVKRPLSATRPSGHLNALASLNKVKISLPGRNQTLNLLVKGAWIGIGILAGTFFLVHFVLVKDFLPK